MNALDEHLFLAACRGNLNEVARSLQRGANMNKVCSTGRTSLGVAAQTGNLAILKLFLKIGEVYKDISPTPSTSDPANLGYFVMVHNEADLPESDQNDSLMTKDFYTEGIDFDDFNEPLLERIPWLSDRCVSLDEVATPDGMRDLEWEEEILDDRGVSIMESDPWGALYIWYANILSQTAALVEEKPPPDDVNSADQYGCTALHYAAIEGHKDVMSLLIPAGCSVNAKENDNFTPLHLAATKDRPDVIDLLLKYGANPQHRSTDGVTPLHVAASRGLLGNVSLLIGAGANVNAIDISDRTPLYLAASRKQHAVVEYLIEKGAKVNFESVSGYTPLFEAVCNKDVRMVETLLAAGAKVTQSHHLLHYSVRSRHEAMVRLLLKAGIVINLRDDCGDTPLMLAVRSQSVNIVRLLLEHGASIHCMNSMSRQTPLADAISYITKNCEQFEKMFSLLEEFGWNWKMEQNALSFSVTANNDHAVSTIIRRWDIVTDENLAERNDMLNLLLLRGDRFLVELFIMAGFNLQSFRPLSTAHPSPQWFQYYMKTPLSLCELSRISIRKSLSKNISNKVTQLHLPPILKNYLKLHDVPCPCKFTNE